MADVMTPELSRRLGRAVGQHVRTPAEYATILRAIEATEAGGVRVWGDLPADVRELVEQIESRPFL